MSWQKNLVIQLIKLLEYILKFVLFSTKIIILFVKFLINRLLVPIIIIAVIVFLIYHFKDKVFYLI